MQFRSLPDAETDSDRAGGFQCREPQMLGGIYGSNVTIVDEYTPYVWSRADAGTATLQRSGGSWPIVTQTWTTVSESDVSLLSCRVHRGIGQAVRADFHLLGG